MTDTATLLLAVMATPVLVRADEAILAWRRVRSLSLPDSVPEPLYEDLQKICDDARSAAEKEDFKEAHRLFAFALKGCSSVGS